MEKTITIGLNFNTKNALLSELVAHFATDLTQCLKRYGITTNVAPPSSAVSTISFLSMADTDDEALLGRCKEASNQKGNLLIALDPIEAKILEGLGYSQPILLWDKVFETSEVRLFRRDNPLSQEAYWERIADIALELCPKDGDTKRGDASRVVYLSQVDISQAENRDNLRRDLADLGYRVLPDKPISTNYHESIGQIKGWIAESSLVLHIIPPVYSTFFATQHLSLAEHQCSIAAQMINNGSSNTKRIVWIPSGYEISDEENQIFVERIQRDPDQTLNTNVIKSTIEDLKRAYRQTLEADSTHSEHHVQELDAYLIHDSAPDGGVRDLDKLLRGKNLSVAINSVGITYNQHLRNLAKARNVVICYASVNKPWLDVKVNDILKSRGIGRFKPFTRVVLLDRTNNLNPEKYVGIVTDIVGAPHEAAGLIGT